MAKKPVVTKHAFDPDIESYLTSIYREEVETSISNNSENVDIFEQTVAMFEGQRVVKDYDWESNLSLKEGTSILLTDGSTSVNQYFQSRDFVEVRLEGDSDEDALKCSAAKKTINKTLNNRRLYHYMKFNRAKHITNMASHVYALCFWRQDIERKQVGFQRKWQDSGQIDEFGRRVWNAVEDPVIEETIKMDMFDYDVFDPRNVFVSDEYTYNIQQKKRIIFRSEMTYEEMKTVEKQNGYINLDLVKEMSKPPETETSKKSYNKDKNTTKDKKTPIKSFDLYTRFGKIWAIVEERTEDGMPKAIKPGYDKDGNVTDDAELVEAIVCFAVSGSNSVLVRFDATPYIDSRGNTYKPALRGICYPHPTKDTGLGEGELILDLDAGINDSFNLMFDTAKLKTIPTTVTDKFAADDNDSIFVQPGHNIAIEGGKKAFDFIQVPNSLTDMMGMTSLIKNHTEQVTSTYPTTMGNVGGIAASTTATAIAGAESRTNLRQNYQSLTWEYTYLVDFYWLILQMTWQFSRPETALKIMGDDVYHFDPDADYTYSPVTSAIETEFNRFRMMQMVQQTIATLVPLAQVPQSGAIEVINQLLEKYYDLLGPDLVRMNKKKLNENIPPQMLQGSPGGPGSQPAIGMGTSNQNGQPMSMAEQGARQGIQQTGTVA